jgi:hypothetical protein
MSEKTHDTTNMFCVGASGALICTMVPVPPYMTKETALNLAAWIVAIADPGRGEFDALHKAVCNT